MPSNNCRDIIFFNLIDSMSYSDVFVVNADFTGRPFIEIGNKYPGHLVQVGIAEQNMIAVSCGLALAGKKVVTYSPNPFEYLRAYDQIRNGMCVMNLPITIVANGMGFVNPGLGITHLTTEDYQMFSLLPNMTIFTVIDENIAKYVSKTIVAGVNGPTYIRVDYNCDGVIGDVSQNDFENGFRILKSGKKKLVISHGYATKTCMNILGETEFELLEIFRRPFNINALEKVIRNYESVLVVEEQQTRGGLGSELLEYKNKLHWSNNIAIIGIDYDNDFPSFFGSREYWMRKYGLDEKSIRSAIETL